MSVNRISTRLPGCHNLWHSSVCFNRVLAKGSHAVSEAERGKKIAILESVQSKWQNGSIINNRLVIWYAYSINCSAQQSDYLWKGPLENIWLSFLCPFQWNRLSLCIYLEHMASLLFFKIWWHHIGRKYCRNPIHIKNETIF
jgi:hypothetical protein